MNSHAKSLAKHQRLVNILASELEKKPYVKWVRTNVDYELGECDVLTKQGNRLVYYEVKCNNTPGGYKKAQKQLSRWANFNKSKNARGVYVTPQYMELME